MSGIYSISEKFDLDYKYNTYNLVKERKTIQDVLTVGNAITSKKSSKNHKLKPREIKRDRTKSTDAKTVSKIHRNSISIKFDTSYN